ncbi:PBPRA1643 family SWIM/SEC-C metal-binding motif protein [Agarivorans sp.]|uniref:PBPRA1643 family SWIM/SEC-C metal-binding motif protein n=1 Tax=Agarivorans sp. TaxID=1872412 RepID=UPI003D0588D6
MSKFFYKGRIEKKPKHQSFGFNTKRVIKPGSAEAPLSLSVHTQEKKQQLLVLAERENIFVDISVDPDQEERTEQLDIYLKKPETSRQAKTPKRNELCHCGSGKKFKKCCA